MIDAIHTQLTQPKALRKALLETALASVETTKTIEHLLQFQEEKQRVKEALSESLEKFQTQISTFLKTVPPLPEEFISKHHRLMQRHQSKNALSPPENSIAPQTAQEQNIDRDIAELRAKLQRMQL